MSDIEFITEMNHRRARERELGMRYAELAKLRERREKVRRQGLTCCWVGGAFLSGMWPGACCMNDEKITVEFRPEQLEDVIEAVVRAAEQDAEDIEILASMAHPDREVIEGLAESRKRLSTLAAWLQHVMEEAEA